MNIQINTDNTLNGNKQHQDFFSAQIADELKRYDSHITRIEVYLKDETGPRHGINDISCVLEARLENRKPIAVTSQAYTSELAVTGAIDKIKSALETIIGRMQNQ